jgi:hypothetical protein
VRGDNGENVGLSWPSNVIKMRKIFTEHQSVNSLLATVNQVVKHSRLAIARSSREMSSGAKLLKTKGNSRITTP